MTRIFLLFIGILVVNCGLAQQDSKSLKGINQINWLVGTWIRTNSKVGSSGVEVWKKSNPGELTGSGIHMKGQDTVFVEKIKILAKDGALYYVADVPENAKPVYFKLTDIKENEFICENPQHDFPKKISYQLTGTKLRATISGDGKAIDYYFERK